MKNYQGMTVVVTGAGSGMGRSYALEAARRGAVLALNDVDESALAATVDALPPGTEVLAECYDVADAAATAAFAVRVAERWGGADVVINNAGVESGGTPVWATPEEASRRVLEINFWGVVHGTRAFLPQLLRSERGTLVNVSSLFGLVGAPHQADYCAAKFAVRGWTEALSAELAETHVRVYLVHPGGVATGISRNEAGRGFAAKYLRTDPDRVARTVLDAVGTGRTRIITGHRASTTALGARLLPQRLMSRLVWRDLRPTLDLSHHPVDAARAESGVR